MYFSIRLYSLSLFYIGKLNDYLVLLYRFRPFEKDGFISFDWKMMIC